MLFLISLCTFLGSQGQAEKGLLASLGTVGLSHSPLPSSSSAQGQEPGRPSPLHPPHWVPQGEFITGYPAIGSGVINQGRAELQPPKCGAHKSRRVLRASQLQRVPERAGNPGAAQLNGAECLVGASCWCSGAPAPLVSLQTPAPSDGNKGPGSAGGESGVPTFLTLLAFRYVMSSGPHNQLGGGV